MTDGNFRQEKPLTLTTQVPIGMDNVVVVISNEQRFCENRRYVLPPANADLWHGGSATANARE